MRTFHFFFVDGGGVYIRSVHDTSSPTKKICKEIWWKMDQDPATWDRLAADELAKGAPVLVSRFDPNHKPFNKDSWTITVVHTGAVWAGHARLVVEGVEEAEVGGVKTSCLLVGYYDIVADDESSSVVSCVRVKESGYGGRDFSAKIRTSYRVSSSSAMKMIQSIKEDEVGVLTNSKRIPYNKLPREGTGEHNCATWCKEKLRIAGIDSKAIKPEKPVILAGCHLM